MRRSALLNSNAEIDAISAAESFTPRGVLGDRRLSFDASCGMRVHPHPPAPSPALAGEGEKN
jgi:hypothetical protein